MRQVGSRDDNASLPRSLVAEALGTVFLLIAIVGSGILGERLAAGNVALALLANALATGAALYALIVWLAPLSGAHLNPLVTLVMAIRGDIALRSAGFYVLTQLAGAVAGVAIADAMFDMPLYAFSSHLRSGPSQWLSEFLITFGLIGMVWTCSRLRPSALAGVVAAYIGGGFWFTATDFANPAVALARALTDTFSGIRPMDVPGFLAAELLGALTAVLLFRWLVPNTR
ncbi:aquaporin family protein [Bradyrhizobium guangdongense]|uniref:Aquaporin family protein n=1 Tax=Bradyrhizobium guangdongense TaxID=1325090 RepID=A0ABX6UT74_9BRAD|nr:aquaporin family protein [Bradyrhizobium guangdongense]QOZ64146.1 aquaporin family protein [Bradyrhizobium guangdongense]